MSKIVNKNSKHRDSNRVLKLYYYTKEKDLGKCLLHGINPKYVPAGKVEWREGVLLCERVAMPRPIITDECAYVPEGAQEASHVIEIHFDPQATNLMALSCFIKFYDVLRGRVHWFNERLRSNLENWYVCEEAIEPMSFHAVHSLRQGRPLNEDECYVIREAQMISECEEVINE